MKWKSFAKRVGNLFNSFHNYNKYSWKHSYNKSLANKWLRKHGKEAYSKILTEYKSDNSFYEWGRANYDRKAAYFALYLILKGELERPDGWNTDEVFNIATTIDDISLFSEMAKMSEYYPITIPLIVKIINEQKLPYRWAGIIKKYTEYGCENLKDALPALRKFAKNESGSDFNDAINAILKKSETEEESKPKKCFHQFQWAGDLTSENRYKVCAKCGHIEYPE